MSEEHKKSIFLQCIRSKSLLLTVILVLTVIVYSNSLHGDFQFDDYRSISSNENVKDPKRFFDKGFLNTFRPGSRLITNLSFSLNYSIGGLKVEGYHVLNIVIHLLMVVFVYIFVRRIFVATPAKERFKGLAKWMALIIAGIFALHPIQTQAVSYVVQRAESLASVFYIASVLLFIRYSETSGWKSYMQWIIGMMIFISGWWVKEIVVTVPAAFLLYTLFFQRDKLRKTIFGAAPVLLIGMVFGIYDVMGFSSQSNVGFNIEEIGQPEYAYTEMRVLFTYLRLIFLPISQNLDYDYPASYHFWDFKVAGALLFWIGLTSLSFLTLRTQGKWMWHFRIVGFGLLWFLLILSPTSSIVPVKDVIFEHRIYLPMLGVIIATAVLVDMASRAIMLRSEWKGMSVVSAVIVVLLMILFGFASHTRNKVWQTKMSLWVDVSKKSPMKARVQNNLGNCFFLQNDYRTALWHYKRSIKLDPEYMEGYYNIVITLRKMGLNDKADEFAKKFKKVHKRHIPANRS